MKPQPQCMTGIPCFLFRFAFSTPGLSLGGQCKFVDLSCVFPLCCVSDYSVRCELTISLDNSRIVFVGAQRKKLCAFSCVFRLPLPSFLLLCSVCWCAERDLILVNSRSVLFSPQCDYHIPSISCAPNLVHQTIFLPDNPTIVNFAEANGQLLAEENREIWDFKSNEDLGLLKNCNPELHTFLTWPHQNIDSHSLRCVHTVVSHKIEKNQLGHVGSTVLRQMIINYMAHLFRQLVHART